MAIGVSVRVRPEDAEAAREILAAVRAGEMAAPEDPTPCPSCGDHPPAVLGAPAAAKRVHARREHSFAKDIEPSNMGGSRVGAPLHIVTASVNTPGSPNDVYRKRGTARFEPVGRVELKGFPLAVALWRASSPRS